MSERRVNYCGKFRRHVWVVANVSQVIQCGVPEFYVCIRCRQPKARQTHPHVCSFPDLLEKIGLSA